MSQSKMDPSSIVGAGASMPPSVQPAGKYEFFKVVQDYLDRAAAVIELARLRPLDPEPAEERDHHQLPGEDGQRRGPPLQGLPHPALQHPRAVQGRHALPRVASRSTT